MIHCWSNSPVLALARRAVLSPVRAHFPFVAQAATTSQLLLRASGDAEQKWLGVRGLWG